MNKLLFTGMGVWTLTSVGPAIVGEWLHIAAQSVALITGIVVLSKHKVKPKELLDYFRDILRSK